MPGPRTIAEYRNELLEARAQIARLERSTKSVEEFKQQVAVKAHQLKAEHGWCDVVDQALEDLGIQAPEHQIEVTITFTFDKALAKQGDGSSASFIWDSLTYLDRVALDSDWVYDDKDWTVEGVKIDGINIDLDK